MLGYMVFEPHIFFLNPKIELIYKKNFGIQKEKAGVLSLFKVCLHYHVIQMSSFDLLISSKRD